jgi:hypothetical protein
MDQIGAVDAPVGFEEEHEVFTGSIRVIGTGREGKGENQFSQPRGICMDNNTKEGKMLENSRCLLPSSHQNHLQTFLLPHLVQCLLWTVTISA